MLTPAVSSDSESDYEIQPTTKSPTPPAHPSQNTVRTSISATKSSNTLPLLTTTQETSKGPKSDAEISAAFTQFYMQRATQEFAEDLDKVRGADDFRDDSLGILVGALRQGTEGFSPEERRRIVTAAEGGKAEK